MGGSLARKIGRFPPRGAFSWTSLCCMNFQYPEFDRWCDQRPVAFWQRRVRRSPGSTSASSRACAGLALMAHDQLRRGQVPERAASHGPVVRVCRAGRECGDRRPDVSQAGRSHARTGADADQSKASRVVVRDRHRAAKFQVEPMCQARHRAARSSTCCAHARAP
jgi:hypothetical protein